VELTGRSTGFGAVGKAVDHQAARATNAFAAIMLKDNRLVAFLDKVFVDDIEHFQEGHVGHYVGSRVLDHFSRLIRAWLPPHTQFNRHVLIPFN
jgi:hypothetical protein